MKALDCQTNKLRHQDLGDGDVSGRRSNTPARGAVHASYIDEFTEDKGGWLVRPCFRQDGDDHGQHSHGEV